MGGKGGGQPIVGGGGSRAPKGSISKKKRREKKKEKWGENLLRSQLQRDPGQIKIRKKTNKSEDQSATRVVGWGGPPEARDWDGMKSFPQGVSPSSIQKTRKSGRKGSNRGH